MGKRKEQVISEEVIPVKSTKDTLAQSLQSSINAKFKGVKVAHFLGDDAWVPADLTSWVSTGSTMLDLAISNRPDGGLPFGRIVELQGWEAAGKSLVAAHVIANTQRLGGVAVLIDTENSINEDFMRAVGVDIEKLLYVQLEALEDIYDAIENIVMQIHESGSDRPVTIVLDSMTAATTKIEQAADFEKDGWATSKAIINSKAMRKLTNLIGRHKVCLIYTQQLRDKLGVAFGDASTVSGGHALKFHASVRIRLKAMGQIKAPVNGVEQVIGVKTVAQIIKNRCGPPFRKATFEIYFDSGIDDYGGWLQVMKDYKLVSTGGAWYTFVDETTGEVLKFQSKDFNEIIETRPDIKKYLYDKICEMVITRYQKAKIGIDDIIIDTDVPE